MVFGLIVERSKYVFIDGGEEFRGQVEEEYVSDRREDGVDRLCDGVRDDDESQKIESSYRKSVVYNHYYQQSMVSAVRDVFG